MLGIQVPRIELVPDHTGDFSAGNVAIELAAYAGLVLFPWQKHVIRYSCLRNDLGKWAAFEVGLIVARQNGKGSVLEARELAGLFAFNEGLQLHSSHEFKTTTEAFRRIRSLIENTDDLRKLVKKITTSHGEEGIELRNGNRLRFVARSTGSGRGFSVDTVYWDEAYNLGSESKAALMPTLSSRPNPQLWYTSSAGWGISVALNDVRLRAVNPRDDDRRLYFAEWSADPDNYDLDDRRDWALANPGLGKLIPEEFVQAELSAMRNDPALFARERLGIGQWPTAEGGWGVIPEDVWDDAERANAGMANPVALCVDVTPDRLWSTIAACGKIESIDEKPHRVLVEITGNDSGLDHRPGTEWVVDRLEEIVTNLGNGRQVSSIVIAPRAPVGSLMAQIENMLTRINRLYLLMKPTAIHEAQACVDFYDAVMKADSLRHRGQKEIAQALSGAKQKETTERLWTWSRKSMSIDISSLWAITLARWGYYSSPGRPKPFVFVTE